MSHAYDSRYDALTANQMMLVNRLCNQFEAGWRLGDALTVEMLLRDVSAQDRVPVLNELLPLEVEYRSRAGQPLILEDYLARFPDLDQSWLAELIDTTRVWTRPTAVSAPESALELPEKLGDYRIICRIGEGGMGTVYKAVHERMGREVALKVLRSEIQRDPKLLKRFDREVRAAARLSHPNVVSALDAREQDGVHFLITEYVEGVDLQALVVRNGPLNVAEAADCLLQAAQGLAYAHRQGIIHRDIKPANLIRSPQGVIKVLDMGLARLDASEGPTDSDLTQSGMVMGTAAYMSPEQARNTRRADARSDIYSLGCTLFYLLNGRSMFVGESPIDTIISHVSEPAPILAQFVSDIPDSLEQVFRKMVAKSPSDRFQSADEVIAALEPLQKLYQAKWGSTRQAIHNFVPQGSTPFNRTELSTNAPTAVHTGDGPTQVHRKPDRGLTRRWVLAGGAVVTIAALSRFVPSLEKMVNTTPTSRFRLSFNGQSSYVAVPELLPEAGESYTLETIAQPLNFHPASNIISWLGPNWMALFVLRPGYVGICRKVGNQSSLLRTKQLIVLGETVHIAGCYRGAQLKLFLNGEAVETIPFDFELAEAPNEGLYIGGVPPRMLPEDQNIRFFEGEVRSVRISRGIRYTTPFARPIQLQVDRSTIASFSFDEGQGSKTKGSGPQPLVGRIVNCEWLSNDPKVK